MSLDPTLLMGITLISTVVLLIGYFIEKYVSISPSKLFGFLTILIFVAILAIPTIGIIWLYVIELT